MRNAKVYVLAVIQISLYDNNADESYEKKFIMAYYKRAWSLKDSGSFEC